MRQRAKRTDDYENGLKWQHHLSTVRFRFFFFIYRCKLDKKEPSLRVFKAKLKATYKLELNVARKNDVLSKRYAFISLLS